MWWTVGVGRPGFEKQKKKTRAKSRAGFRGLAWVGAAVLSPGRGGTDPAFPPPLGTRGREGLFPRTVRVEGRSCEGGWCMMLDGGISGGFPCV